MSRDIHPTAIIEPGAELGENVTVGPYAFVGGKVRLGDDCVVMHHATVTGNSTIGSGNVFHPTSVVGGDPQDLKYHGEDSRLIMGDNNTIRECVTINKGTESGGGLTSVGSNCLIMAYVHIAHDCHLGDRVILSNLVQLAGHIKIDDDAILSGLAAIHHFTTVGRMSFIGGQSAVRMDVPPFMLVEGSPGKVHGLNTVGLMRHKFSEDTIKALKKAYKITYRSDLNRSQAVEKIKAEGLDKIAEVGELLDSFERSAQGRNGRALEGSRTTDVFSRAPANGSNRKTTCVQHKPE